MGKKRKLTAKDDEFEYDPVPKHLVTSHIKKQEKRLIVILENAQLETVKVNLGIKICTGLQFSCYNSIILIMYKEFTFDYES